jgi:hypothetical protein
MYFANFPNLVYSLDGGKTNFLMTDFFRRVVATTNSLLTSTAYDQYTIMDGDTPDILADKLYNDSTLYWVILLSNNIIDPRYDWPLPNNALNQFITDTYGAGNELNIHHYVNTFGDVVPSTYTSTAITSVTNTDFELSNNEAKRLISVIKPQFVPVFVKNVNGLLATGS